MILLEATEVQIQFSDIGITHLRVIFSHLRRMLSAAISRSGGTHLSDIIKYMWFGFLPADSPERIAKEKEAAEDLGDARIMPLRMFLGMAWELFVSGLYPKMRWQAGEVYLDGVAGSPDGFSIAAVPPAIIENTLQIEEFKLTWKSFRNREILKETLWMWQLAGYCKMAGTRFARLHVCWVNGDYSHGENWGPRYFRYLIEFKQHEIDRLWKDMFLNNKEKAIGPNTGS